MTAWETMTERETLIEWLRSLDEEYKARRKPILDALVRLENMTVPPAFVRGIVDNGDGSFTIKRPLPFPDMAEKLTGTVWRAEPQKPRGPTPPCSGCGVMEGLKHQPGCEVVRLANQHLERMAARGFGCTIEEAWRVAKHAFRLGEKPAAVQPPNRVRAPGEYK